MGYISTVSEGENDLLQTYRRSNKQRLKSEVRKKRAYDSTATAHFMLFVHSWKRNVLTRIYMTFSPAVDNVLAVVALHTSS